MLARVWSASIVGINAVKVGVEVDVSGGLPGIVVVGLPDAAVRESRERIRAAITNCGYFFPFQRITITLAPADFRKDGARFNLPAPLCLLCPNGDLPDANRPLTTQLFGDISL